MTLYKAELGNVKSDGSVEWRPDLERTFSTYQEADSYINRAFDGRFKTDSNKRWRIVTIEDTPTPAPPQQAPYVPPTSTPPSGGTIPENDADVFIVEINLGNQTFAKAIKDSGDFFNRVNFLCEKSGYKLLRIYNIYNGEIHVSVKKLGSWSLIKLAGAIIGILGIVLVAIFSGSVVLGGIAVVGGFFAIHYVVRSFINQDIVTQGTKVQDEALNDLKGLIDEVKNDQTLTPEQKQQTIQELYDKISDTLVAIGKDPLPDLPEGLPGTDPGTPGGSTLDDFKDILMLLIIAGGAFALFKMQSSK